MKQGSPGNQASAANSEPAAVAEYRQRLSRGENVVDPETWAGSLPAAQGIAPRVRVGRSKWFNLLWLLPIGWGLLLVAVAVARGLWNEPAVERFIARYPATLITPGSPPGLPWWLDVQHFLNAFFMIFIIRAGLQILADHARLYWTRHSTPGRDWFRFQRPVPDDPLWTAEAGFGQPAWLDRLARTAAFNRAGPMVAPRHRRIVVAKRRRVLRLALLHRPVAPDRALRHGRCSPAV